MLAELLPSTAPAAFWMGVGLILTFALLGLAYLQYQRQRERLDLNLAQSRLADAQAESLQLTNQLGRLEAEVHELRSRYQDLHGHYLGSQQNLALLREEHERLHDRGQELESLRQEQEHSLRHLEAERARLETELRERDTHAETRYADLQEARDALRLQFTALARDIFEAREQDFAQRSQASLAQCLDPLREHLKRFEAQVEQRYLQDTRERHTLTQELTRLQQMNQRLGEEALKLSRALQHQKIQGNWGELVLERVLNMAGLEKGREYDTQVSLHNARGERLQPDLILHLPGERQIIIDAKVSLNAWQEALATHDEALRQSALKRHVAALRNHMKGLAAKNYSHLQGLSSLEAVMLFIPIEAAFHGALEQEPTLLEEAFGLQLLLVSPGTLLATLKVVEHLWRQERQTLNAREIALRAGELHDRFLAFIKDMDSLGLRLRQADSSYQDARNKLIEGRGNLVAGADALRRLGARTSKRLPEHWQTPDSGEMP